jgi:hypothetical protein
LHLPLLVFGGAGRAELAIRVGRPALLNGGSCRNVVRLNQRQQLARTPLNKKRGEREFSNTTT